MPNPPVRTIYQIRGTSLPFLSLFCPRPLGTGSINQHKLSGCTEAVGCITHPHFLAWYSATTANMAV